MKNDCGHGSQVAFLAAGSDEATGAWGVAPGASIVSIQVASKALADYCTWAVKRDEACVVIYPLDVMRALHFIAARVESDPLAFGGMPLAAVNISLHVNRYCDKPNEEEESDSCDSNDDIGKWLSARYDSACSENLFTELTLRLREAHTWTVIAAGNRNPAEKIGFVSMPACADGAVVVSGLDVAVDAAGTVLYTLARTSMYSSGLVTIAAPGVGLETPVYVYSSTGTSYAAPQATGLLALVRASLQDCPLGPDDTYDSTFRSELAWLMSPVNGQAVTILKDDYPDELGHTEDGLVPGLGLVLRAESPTCMN
jgi:hypothetical protein